MPVKRILQDTESRMEKTVEALSRELRTIRTGRASAGLVEHVKVEYYGTETPLRDIAQIGAPDPRLIVVKPYDPSSVKDIIKALQSSDLGLSPSADGAVVRLSVPPLSTERREQLCSHTRKLAEETKIAIRNVRRDGNKLAESEKKASDLTEDDLYQIKEETTALAHKYEKSVDEHVTKKVEEIMTV
ncbi:MAG: ribosome recycling factor [Planctomycetes bacterium]|nr:ribosome recycling factor [Planctomycetota bacterium]